jgi:hypothetical protein
MTFREESAMLGRLRTHLGDHAVGYIALFVALSGTAYAAGGINTVGSKQIINGSVKRIDLADESRLAIYPSNTITTPPLPDTDTSVLTLQVPAGPRAYLVYARFAVNGYNVTGSCTLTAHGDGDQVDDEDHVEFAAGSPGATEPVTSMLVHRTSDKFAASLVCRRTHGETSLRLDNVKISVLGIPR